MAATISASQVKSLRAKTGISMSDCKKALAQADGDESQAMDILQKQYAGQMEKRADKEAANGRIGAFVDGEAGALVELRCETDFVANSDHFKSAADALARLASKGGVTDTDQLLQTKSDDGNTGQDIIAAAYGTLKENIKLARVARIEGGVACYVHHNGLVGTVIAADGDGGELGKQICMHTAAQQTLDGLSRDDIDATEVEKARELMKYQAKGKPENIVEKIVSGKMDKWYGERVLLEQPFALDDKKTVGQVAKDAGITVSGYLRFELGGKGN